MQPYSWIRTLEAPHLKNQDNFKAPATQERHSMYFSSSDKQIFGHELSWFVSVNWAAVCTALDQTEAQQSTSACHLKNGQDMG